MAGEIKHDFIAACYLGLELAQCGFHHFLGEVLLQRNRKSYRLQLRRDRLRIRPRVLERLNVLIAVIADNQREPPRLRSSREGQYERSQRYKASVPDVP